MIASLPMYWRHETAPAWRRLWAEVRRHLPGLPDLIPPEDLPADWDAHWLAPDLVLSQTCGLPFRARLHPHVTYVGTLDFALPDTPPGLYRSVIVTRPDEPRPTAALQLAYNAPDSQSGWAATGGQTFAGYHCTGAHSASVEAVACGAADIAFVDAVTWRILRHTEPGLAARVSVRGTTAATPGLPLISARTRDPEPLRAALSAALSALPDGDRRDMGGPQGLCVLGPAAYLAQPIPAPPPA
ncbi:phosphate/phosphite/phosphonate ABC transporter substrate-binding protein [Maliponia aquimaris]|uniref:ABC transporter, phosphonate, periplasmic substrate-binding protein n=1 Tax=Maliponia aquimaris TaxID=1673631 RepID=A0A238KKZ5_9RHOB|nr:PhnD/SsuA/transferrin family substrate-binding protein [Maliponia aquimaris]SMX43287.1 ABC transporter, phosphonate, periplasmic substrate-binding protein [Maliponia aquimaris]